MRALAARSIVYDFEGVIAEHTTEKSDKQRVTHIQRDTHEAGS